MDLSKFGVAEMEQREIIEIDGGKNDVVINIAGLIILIGYLLMD